MKHFKPEEFACNCRCGKGFSEMQRGTLAKLDQAREIASVPFELSSAFRCIEHNRRIGGKVDSAHTRGHAVDIITDNSNYRFAILEGLIRAGFKRIGMHASFIHADDDPSLPDRVCWVYK